MRQRKDAAPPRRPAPQQQRRRLEIAATRPGEDVVQALRAFLSGNGRGHVAAKLAVGMPAWPERPTVFDLGAAAKAGPNADPGAAVVATFGPSPLLGLFAGEQAWRDARAFVLLDEQREQLESAQFALRQFQRAAELVGPLVERIDAHLAAIDGPPEPAALPAPVPALPEPAAAPREEGTDGP